MHLIREVRPRCVMVVTALAVMTAACMLSAQDRRDGHSAGPAMNQYVVLLKRGPKWIPTKGVGEQPLLEHGRYLNRQMLKGALQLAGPFLDDSGGLIVFNARDEAEVRAITERDPGVVAQILEVESIHPFHISFDAATGKTPFKSGK